MTIFAGEVGRQRAVLMAVGLIQGLSAYGLSEAAAESGDVDRLLYAGWILVGCAPPLAILAYRVKQRLPTAAYAVGTGLLLAGLFLLADWRLDWSDGVSPVRTSILLTAILTGYVSLPYFQAALEERALRFPYQRLFHHAWNNIFYILLALLFTGTLWLILHLWGELFELLEISFFGELFARNWFRLPVHGAAFAIAVALLRENAAVIATARRIVIALFRILAPILAVALLLFLIALAFTGLAPIADIGSVTSIMLAVMGLSVLFANAVIQDGSEDNAFPPIVNGLIAANMLALVAYAALAAYGAGLRVAQYGLTPSRVHLLLLVGVFLLYALAYAIAVLWRRSDWPHAVRRFNPYLAPVPILLALLVHTPLLEPHRLSANDQYDRLREGTVSADAFAFGYLKFELGRFGRERLEAIRNDATLPDRGVIEARLAALDEMETKADWLRSRLRLGATKESLAALNLWPDGAQLPDALSDALLQDPTNRLASCKTRKGPPCALLMIDLTRDGAPEAVLITGNFYLFYERDEGDGSWSKRGSNYLALSAEQRDALHAAIREGDIETVEPPPPRSWLRIGEETLKP